MTEHSDFIKLQEETLGIVLTLLEKEPGVVGLVLYGSMAVKTNDAFSDIDLVCYLSEPDEAVISHLIGLIETIHPLLSKMWIYGRNSLFLYCNGIRLDLDLLPEAEIRVLPADPIRILYDPQGKIAGEIPAKRLSQPAHPKHFQPGEALTDWFFWMFRQVYCWIKRGAQSGPRAYEKLYAAFLSMNEMRQTLTEMRRWTLGSDAAWQDVDSVFAAGLSSTFSSLEPPDMLHAARTLLVLFESACDPYCRKCGTPFPEEKLRTMKNMLDVFDALS